jgi:hypothetical protein
MILGWLMAIGKVGLNLGKCSKTKNWKSREGVETWLPSLNICSAFFPPCVLGQRSGVGVLVSKSELWVAVSWSRLVGWGREATLLFQDQRMHGNSVAYMEK